MIAKKLVLGAAAVAALGLGGTLAAGAGGAAVGGPFRGKIREFILGRLGSLAALRAELGLTDEQRGKVAAAVAARKAQIGPVARRMVDRRRALRDAVLEESPDEKKIREAAGRLGEAIGDAAVLASQVVGEVRPTLTAEQRKRIEQARAEHDKAVDALLKELFAE
jgi:Spy/CpxP family protein refolding chaperone